MSRFDELLKINTPGLHEQATSPNPVSWAQPLKGNGEKEEEDAEGYVKNMTFDQFLEKIIQVLGSNIDMHSKLRFISKMVFDAKRGINDEEDAENKQDDAEEGELMTNMKQQGLIPKGSKPVASFSGTREKR